MKEITEDIAQLRNVFSVDVDEETRAENEEQIQEWESALIKNQNMLSWKEHDITKEITLKATDSYIEVALQLATNRTHNDRQRDSLYARQDAMLWVILLSSDDPQVEITAIHNKIKTALGRTI